MANNEPPHDNDDVHDVDDDIFLIGVAPGDLRMVTMPLNSRPGPNDTGPPPVPDPWYIELKDEIEGMCGVAKTWFEHIGNHVYTRQITEDIEEFQFKMTMFLTSLEYPKPASETPPLDEFGNVRTTKEEYWEYLKDEYNMLKKVADNMRTAPKRVRRTPSGDEAPIRMDNFISSQTIGSTSQRAPTSAPPSTEPIAEDTDDGHHAQPSTPTRE